MSSPIADALTASIANSMDPMNAIVPQLAQTMVAERSIALTKSKATAIAEIEQLLTAAQNRNADTVVVTSLQKLLNSLSS